MQKALAKDMTESRNNKQRGKEERERGKGGAAYVEKGFAVALLWHFSYFFLAPPVSVLSINQFSYEHNTHTPRGTGQRAREGQAVEGNSELLHFA